MANDPPGRFNGDRALDEVVALDCWHGAFDESRSARLHAHVSFKPAKFAARSEFGTFTVIFRLFEARVAVTIPPTEPIMVDPDHVYSGPAQAKVRQTDRIEEAQTRSSEGRAGAALTAAGPRPDVGASAARKRSRSTTRSRETEAETGPIAVRSWHRQGTYSWLLTPARGIALDGDPWARGQPLMRLVRTDAAANRLDTAVYVEVKAKREHLDISVRDFVPDKVSLRDKAFRNIKRANLAAAEACIRNAILAQGLEDEGFDDSNAFLTLARVMAAGKEP